MTKFNNKSFTVPMSKRETEDERMKKQGYEKQPGGWWMKSKIKDLGIKTECPRCGKSDLSKIDAAPMYDWNMCRNCYVESVEGREEQMLRMAIQIVATGEISDEVAKSALKLIHRPGMKRWVKKNWSAEQYDALYGMEDEDATTTDDR
jgi:hypothetical protein